MASLAEELGKAIAADMVLSRRRHALARGQR